MRRFFLSCACFAVALSAHASVRSTASAAKFNGNSVSIDRPVQTSEPRALTAAPADRLSFYPEFYSTESLPSAVQGKSGIFRRFATAIKKTVQKVNPISN